MKSSDPKAKLKRPVRPGRQPRSTSRRSERGGIDHSPAISMLRHRHPVLWLNPFRATGEQEPHGNRRAGLLRSQEVADAAQKIERYRRMLAIVFPQMRNVGGPFESPLLETPALTDQLLDGSHGLTLPLLVKCDQTLPLSGSFDLRAALFALLERLEQTVAHPETLSKVELRQQLQNAPTVYFSGAPDLALAVALIGCPLGFDIEIEIPDGESWSDWKIERLLLAGARIVPHCRAGRGDHSVDLSRRDLMLGYATAGKELARQLEARSITVDRSHPLMVYLPSGNGLAASATVQGLRLALGAHVHCFLGSSAQQPSFALSMMSGRARDLAEIDFVGYSSADGLAARRSEPLALAGARAGSAGCFTAIEEWLYAWLFEASRLEALTLEPAAAIGFIGAEHLLGTEAGRRYQHEKELADSFHRARHLVWATAGGLIPTAQLRSYRERGRGLAEACS